VGGMLLRVFPPPFFPYFSFILTQQPAPDSFPKQHQPAPPGVRGSITGDILCADGITSAGRQEALGRIFVDASIFCHQRHPTPGIPGMCVIGQASPGSIGVARQSTSRLDISPTPDTGNHHDAPATTLALPPCDGLCWRVRLSLRGSSLARLLPPQPRADAGLSLLVVGQAYGSGWASAPWIAATAGLRGGAWRSSQTGFAWSSSPGGTH